jgi:hypothetical protein
MMPYANALLAAAERRAAARPMLDAEAMEAPAPGTCAAVQAAATRRAALAETTARRIAADLVAAHSDEMCRRIAGYLLDASAGRHGVHPDTLRAEGGL